MSLVSNEELKEIFKDWFSGLAADFYNVGIQKFVTQYDKYVNLHGDFVK
jgi:hypothetical protein